LVTIDQDLGEIVEYEQERAKSEHAQALSLLKAGHEKLKTKPAGNNNRDALAVIAALSDLMDQGFATVNARFDALDIKLNTMNTRIGTVNARIDHESLKIQAV
jgi:hypothetical protein